MRFWLSVMFWGMFMMAGPVQAADQAPPVLDFEMKSLSGEQVDLAKYQGSVVLIVNTASECGLTPQYEGLQALHEKHAEQGLAILGFPSNQFGEQEPGSAAEIVEFCRENYGVTFPMFAKIDVNGPNAAPLYKYLTGEQTNPKFAGPIKWNFNKFLIGREGQVIARFEPRVEPESKEVQDAIETALAQKP